MSAWYWKKSSSFFSIMFTTHFSFKNVLAPRSEQEFVQFFPSTQSSKAPKPASSNKKSKDLPSEPLFSVKHEFLLPVQPIDHSLLLHQLPKEPSCREQLSKSSVEMAKLSQESSYQQLPLNESAVDSNDEAKRLSFSGRPKQVIKESLCYCL